jgi:hypothetical protein
MIDTNSDMRIMANNLLDTGYNSFAVSSVADGFFEEDLTLPERSRHFKFGGRFTIDATNKKIYVNGVTYNLTVGEYNTPADLAAHITTVITAQGVTCSWSAGNFVFTKGSSFTLNLATTTDAVWETIGLIDGVNQSGTSISSDMPRYHYPNESFVIDFGYQAPLGFIALIGDLTQELKIPEGATITLQANNVNDFTSPPVDKTLTWTKRGVFGFIDDVDGDGWRYVKLILDYKSGPYHAEIGYLYIGDYFSFQDRNVSNGIDIGFVDTSMVSDSDDGQQFTNQKASYRKFEGLQVGLALPANVNLLKHLFYLKQMSVPFFVALDPTLAISETLDDMTFFCKFSKEPTGKHVQGRFFDLGFELKEAL